MLIYIEGIKIPQFLINRMREKVNIYQLIKEKWSNIIHKVPADKIKTLKNMNQI